MNFNELQSQVMEKMKDVAIHYKIDIKHYIEKAINEVLKENDIDYLRAFYEYGERSNIVKIIPAGVSRGEYFWPIYVEYHTSRTLIKSSYRYGNEYKYTIKSIEILNNGEREVDVDKKIKIENTQDYALAEEYAMNRRKNQAEDEKATLKRFMEKNPEFIKMMDYYNKYKYQLR